MLRRFIDYYKPHRKLFLPICFCLSVGCVRPVYPMIAKISSMSMCRIKSAAAADLVGGVIGHLSAQGGFNYFVNYYGHIVGVRMQADMRRDVFRRLQKLPFSFYDENKTGSIMSRIINDLMDISELAHPWAGGFIFIAGYAGSLVCNPLHH